MSTFQTALNLNLKLLVFNTDLMLHSLALQPIQRSDHHCIHLLLFQAQVIVKTSTSNQTETRVH